MNLRKKINDKFKVGCWVRFGYSWKWYEKQGWSFAQFLTAGNRWWKVAKILTNNQFYVETLECVWEFGLDDIDEIMD